MENIYKFDYWISLSPPGFDPGGASCIKYETPPPSSCHNGAAVNCCVACRWHGWRCYDDRQLGRAHLGHDDCSSWRHSRTALQLWCSVPATATRQRQSSISFISIPLCSTDVIHHIAESLWKAKLLQQCSNEQKTYKISVLAVDWWKHNPEPQVCFLIVYLLCSQDDVSDPVSFDIKNSFYDAWFVDFN